MFRLLKQLSAFWFQIQPSLTFLLVVGLILYIGYQKYEEQQAPRTLSSEESYATNASEENRQYPGRRVSSIYLPDSLSFAGESVPLYEDEVREKLERELLVNVFWESHTSYIIKRSQRWFPMMEKMLRQEGIPDDFKYLAVAESELSNVTSPAGAKGFWQIMSYTGREYGLEISGQVDERYDPVKSGKVACQYLKNAYKRFSNWTVAAASYNMGMGGIQREMETQKSTSYYDLVLNQETSRYIYRILAFKLILENPEKYHFHIPEDERYRMPEMRYLTIKSSIPDLISYAHSQGTSYKTLRHYNPWLREYSLSVGNGRQYVLQLPKNAPPIHGKRLLTTSPPQGEEETADSLEVQVKDSSQHNQNTQSNPL